MTSASPRHPARAAAFVLLATALLLAAGCHNPLPAFPADAASDPAAKAVIERAAAAHGGMETWEDIDAVAVGFGGEWMNDVWKVQPVLVDVDFRKVSRERYLFRDADGQLLPHPVVAQRHDAEGGTKWVRWQGRDVPVGIAYRGQNGEPVAPHGVAREVTESSALVAEAYRMFLTGPFFFLERDAREGAETTYARADDDDVNGVPCEQVLVRLRPGIGLSAEDRVLVSVGRDDGLVRRVRFSLEGFSGTRGAVADVSFGKWTSRGGIRWPRTFLETVVFPINREVHAWEMNSLSLERTGVATEGPAAAGVGELTPADWSDRAAGRARPVRVMSNFQESDWPEEVIRDLPPDHPARRR